MPTTLSRRGLNKLAGQGSVNSWDPYAVGDQWHLGRRTQPLCSHPRQIDRTVPVGEGAGKNPNWLPGLDSNQGFQLQRLTCYPYTTGQC